MRKASLLLVGALLLMGCGEGGYTGPRYSQEVTANTWDARVLRARGPVLVDCYATWCGPCRRMEPVVESIARDHTVYKLDIDQNRSITSKYDVHAYPTFLIFHNGRLAKRLVGMKSERELRAALGRFDRGT
jgi:thioredoxin 1